MSAKVLEHRFSYNAQVLQISKYLLVVQRKIGTDIDSGRIPEKNVEKAKNYLKLIDNILRSEYMNGNYLTMRIMELMNILKDDDRELNDKINFNNNKIKRLEEVLDTSPEYTIPEAYVIPSEIELFTWSIRSKREKLEAEIKTLKIDVQLYKSDLKICRDLKGIICRPHGFFEILYRS